MADTTNGGNGRRFAPSFRNELSLGNVLVLAGLIAGGVGFMLRYENRMTTVETNAANDRTAIFREIDRLDRDIGLSRNIRGLRRDTGELIDLHKGTP